MCRYILYGACGHFFRLNIFCWKTPSTTRVVLLPPQRNMSMDKSHKKHTRVSTVMNGSMQQAVACALPPACDYKMARRSVKAFQLFVHCRSGDTCWVAKIEGQTRVFPPHPCRRFVTINGSELLLLLVVVILFVKQLPFIEFFQPAYGSNQKSYKNQLTGASAINVCVYKIIYICVCIEIGISLNSWKLSWFQLSGLQN